MNWNNQSYGQTVDQIFNGSVLKNATKKYGLTGPVIFPSISFYDEHMNATGIYIKTKFYDEYRWNRSIDTLYY